MPRRSTPRKHIPYQPASSCQSKRQFTTELQATKAADMQMLMDMKLDIRVYQCNECRLWHLTRSTGPQQH